MRQKEYYFDRIVKISDIELDKAMTAINQIDSDRREEEAKYHRMLDIKYNKKKKKHREIVRKYKEERLPATLPKAGPLTPLARDKADNLSMDLIGYQKINGNHYTFNRFEVRKSAI